MDEQQDVKHFVRVSIIELLRMNEVEEAIEAEKAYQVLYPGSFAYFPDINYVENIYVGSYYLKDNGTDKEYT